MNPNDTLVTYKTKNKNDKYYTLTTEEKMKVDDMVAMFIKELITERGSNLFDRNYGSTFMNDIGDTVNIYKIRYFLENDYDYLYDKYGITRVDVEDVRMNTNSGFLDIWFKIIFKDFSVKHYSQVLFNGTFTEKTILELEQ